MKSSILALSVKPHACRYRYTDRPRQPPLGCLLSTTIRVCMSKILHPIGAHLVNQIAGFCCPSAPEQSYADPSTRCTAISASSWIEFSVGERGVLPLRFSALGTCCIMESSAQPTNPRVSSPRPEKHIGIGRLNDDLSWHLLLTVDAPLDASCHRCERRLLCPSTFATME
jgi:hypothetical protein